MVMRFTSSLCLHIRKTDFLFLLQSSSSSHAFCLLLSALSLLATPPYTHAPQVHTHAPHLGLFAQHDVFTEYRASHNLVQLGQ